MIQLRYDDTFFLLHKNTNRQLINMAIISSLLPQYCRVRHYAYTVVNVPTELPNFPHSRGNYRGYCNITA